MTADRPSLLYLVKQLELVIRSHLESLVRPWGITALQYTALTVLERRGGLSAAQLARDSFVTAQTMADMVHALEDRGLVRRDRNPANRRELLVSLTSSGAELLTACAGPVRELEQRMAAELDQAEFRALLTSAWKSLS